MKGRLIQQYRVDALLGEGGMGTVYQATDTLLERLVAMKMLHPHLLNQTSFMERFRNEALILARLNHPNIAVVYNLLQDGTDYFMAMEYVAGETLEALLRRTGSLSPAVAAEIVRQGLEGLTHAHRKNILHRDIKPANLMLTPEGTVKLMDFGIARMAGEQRLTQANRIVGTLEYMAPELIRGEAPSPASDIYAMGVLLYELLSGKLPFASNTDYELMQSIIKDKPIPLRKLNGQIPKEMEAIVQKALDKNPAKRFTDAKEFQQALQPFYTQAPVLDPATLGPTLPMTAVLDIQPKRQLTSATKRMTPATQIQRMTQLSTSWVRANWELSLAGVLTLLAVVFIVLMLTDTAPTENTTASIDSVTDQTPVQQMSDEPAESSGAVSLPTGQTNQPVQAPVTKPAPVDDSPRSGTPKEPEPNNPEPRKSEPRKPIAEKPGAGKSGNPNPVAPRDEKPPVQEQPATGTPTDPVVERPAERSAPTSPASSQKSIAIRRVRVNLALTESISSASAKEGQNLRFRVTESVMSDGQVVIREGATAYGEITRIKRTGDGLFTNRDLLEIRIQAVEAVNGQQIPLRSATISQEAKGEAVLFRSGQTFEVRTGDSVITLH
ncbi:serine/threonine protein kinase [Nibrella viscosa]